MGKISLDPDKAQPPPSSDPHVYFSQYPFLRGVGMTGSKITMGPTKVKYHSLSLTEGRGQSQTRTESPGPSYLG